MRTILSSVLVAAVLMGASPSVAEDSANIARLKLTRKCPNCDLSGANMHRMNLLGADLSGANLSGANLSGANLYRTTLSGANLSGADLSGANLKLANLIRANLSGANLSGAVLRRAWFCRTRMPDGEMRNDHCEATGRWR